MTNVFSSGVAPGAGAPISGPKWPRHPTSGHLRLPSGVTIDGTPTEALRSELARLGIAGAHTDGRDSNG
jgi:hypothetical protein